ncbi:MAG TPA: TIGR04211 family SH3 domain-containing protein [Woeseiaceae bacterium]|nr:TIGR04211 family SH3 domain-containing protein [Woeseiaceae bacterium]
MTRTRLQACLLLGGLLCAAAGLRAEPVWISDQFEVMLRTGPSTSNAITRVLPSGTQLEMLERDATEEYSRVSTLGGTEGWVLTRYLMGEPSAREQLQKLTAQLTNARSEGNSLGSQLAAITREHDAATAQIASLQREKQALQDELEEIKRTAANVLAIDQLNKDLREQLTDAEIKVSTLEQENRELMGQTTRNWFLAGGLVMLVGIVLGLWLPRIRWQKRSRYERF